MWSPPWRHTLVARAGMVRGMAAGYRRNGGALNPRLQLTRLIIQGPAWWTCLVPVDLLSSSVDDAKVGLADRVSEYLDATGLGLLCCYREWLMSHPKIRFVWTHSGEDVREWEPAFFTWWGRPTVCRECCKSFITCLSQMLPIWNMANHGLSWLRVNLFPWECQKGGLTCCYLSISAAKAADQSEFGKWTQLRLTVAELCHTQTSIQNRLEHIHK